MRIRPALRTREPRIETQVVQRRLRYPYCHEVIKAIFLHLHFRLLVEAVSDFGLDAVELDLIVQNDGTNGAEIASGVWKVRTHTG